MGEGISIALIMLPTQQFVDMATHFMRRDKKICVLGEKQFLNAIQRTKKLAESRCGLGIVSIRGTHLVRRLTTMLIVGDPRAHNG